MNKETKNILESAGWYENRNNDITELIYWAEKKGFFYPESVKKFLRCYGNLQVSFVTPIGYKEEFDFNPLPSFKGAMDKEFVECEIEENYEEIIQGEKLYYVGRCYRGNMLIVVSETEHCYAYTDGCIIKLGDSFEEMLECLCYVTKPTQYQI